jgi:hypothetical protein
MIFVTLLLLMSYALGQQRGQFLAFRGPDASLLLTSALWQS